MKKILPAVIAGTVLCFATNGFMSCVTKGQNDGVADSDSVVVETDDDAVDTIRVETQKAQKNSKYAEVSVGLSLPAGDGVAKTIRQALLKILGEKTSECMKGFTEGNTKVTPYNEGVGTTKSICNYYCQPFFNTLGTMCKTEYDSNVEYIKNDESLTEEQRKEQLSYVSLQPYGFDENLVYVGQTATYVTFTFNIYSFLGGAHGSTTGDYVTFNKKTGAQVKDLLKKGAAKQMQRLLKDGLKEYFRENGQKISSDKELMENLQIEGSVIPLPSDGGMALRDDGLLLVYGQYEIACYAAGMPSFVIPYAKVMPYMTDEAKEIVHSA